MQASIKLRALFLFFITLWSSPFYAATNTAPAKQYDVVIIGAGTAGLAAAQTLYQQGVTNMLVIEARDRIGGRVWSTEVWGPATELGASWIRREDSNPLTALAKNQNITLTPTSLGTFYPFNKFSSLVIYDDQGKKVDKDRIQATLKQVAEFYDELKSNKLTIKNDESLQDAVIIYTASKTMDSDQVKLFQFILNEMIENDTGSELNETSYQTITALQSTVSGKDVMPSRAYIHVVSPLAKNIPIQLNETVKEVIYNNEGVEIKTSKGRYKANYAISTLPLGVMQAKTVTFTPDLPAEKQKAIEQLGMNSFNKIYLLFDQVFWDKDAEWLTFMPEDDEPDDVYVALNYYKFTKQPILLFLTRGNFSKEVESWSDKETIDDIMDMLKQIYGNDIPRPSARIITRWGKDPFANGSYSYPKLGSSIKSYEQLASPVAGRLFFAGEATSSTDPGTVHGAYLSGVAAANEITEFIKNK